jgi:hypothetical protein
VALELDKDQHAEIESLVALMLDEAEDHYTSVISPDRVAATDYYKGRPFGNEETGRSQVVLAEIRAAVRALMPTLMRLFTGPERYVEFQPQGQEDAPLARQQTDYVNHVMMVDNAGFRILYGTFKDALVRRTGVIKWWVEKTTEDEAAEFTGLTEQQVLVLLMDRECEVEKLTPGDDGFYGATVTKKAGARRIRVDTVPGEELRWSVETRDFDTAPLVSHVRYLPRHELRDLGVEEDILDAAPEERMPEGKQEEEARRPEGQLLQPDATRDPEMETLRYDEAYARLKIGKRRVQLYRVCTVTETHKLASVTPISHVPLAHFTPDPEPHTLEGTSFYDDLRTVQLAKSEVLRRILDSLSLALEQNMVIADGRVNLKDLLNTETSRIIRADDPAAVVPITHRFVGGDALPVLALFDDIKETATGTSRAAMGLDADALQSTTKAAVAATMSAAQAQAELIARNFAETGMKTLYRGLLRTIVENQDAPRVVRLRGNYVEVDPRAWNATLDVTVNVGLGQGTPEDKMNFLGAIAARQEGVIQLLGAANPLVSIGQLRNTYARAVEQMGFRHAGEFFKEITPEQEQQFEQAAAQGGESKDPNAALAAAEVKKAEIAAQTAQQKMQMDAQMAQAKMMMEREEMQIRLEFEREKLALELALKTREFEVKHGVSVEREQLKAEVEMAKAQLDSTTKLAVESVRGASSDKQALAKTIQTGMQTEAQRDVAAMTAARKESSGGDE